uniref:AAA+ ATPase domain-containing protein n=1 Tax=viral metagenome TaxID=1070528 RepID=A0A6C0ABT5_9ZZZZ
MNDFNPFDDYSDDDIDNKTTKENNTNLPWIEKYRPKQLSDIASHEKIMGSLKVFIQDESLPHILFYGPPGTGKTSTIQAYARQIYGDSYSFMVMEINASEDRGIDLVRNKIKQFASSTNYFQKLSGGDQKYKLIILDEVDAMTEDAQSILRYVMDNYVGNTRFCLICNYIKNIDEALQSRCTCFRFSPIPDKEMTKIIKKISEKENLTITKSGIDSLIKISNGDLRKVLNNLQSLGMIYDKITESKIDKCFGYPSKDQIGNILQYLTNSSIEESYNEIENLIKEHGLSLSDIINELFRHLKDKIQNDETIDKKTKNIYAEYISRLRCIEVNQSINSSDTIQISGTVSCFKI